MEVKHVIANYMRKYKEGKIDSKTGEIYNNLINNIDEIYKKIIE